MSNKSADSERYLYPNATSRSPVPTKIGFQTVFLPNSATKSVCPGMSINIVPSM